MKIIEGRLSVREKVALGLEVLVTYVMVRGSMKRLPLPAAVRWLRSRGASWWPSTRAHDEERLTRATVRTITRLPTDSRCLMRSLTLMTILERRGTRTQLVIGVDPGTGGFAAHAWIERDGAELLPSGDGRFERLLEL